MCSWLCIVCIKRTEPLSFDSHVETQRFLCPPQPGHELETPRTATAGSSRSATEAPRKTEKNDVIRVKASVAEWLERAIAMRDVSGSIPDRGRRKILCGHMGPSDYISFCKVCQKDSGFIFLHPHTQIKPKNNITTSPHNVCTYYRVAFIPA